MKIIPLTKNKVAIVDDDDYEWLSQFKWCVTKSAHNYYAVRKENGTRIWMHRAIMGLQKDDPRVVHHDKNDSLDNRRAKLEICTNEQNLAYRKWRGKKK